MGDVCIREDQLAHRQGGDDRALGRVRGEVLLHGQVVHVGEVLLRIDLVMFLQSSQGGAVLQEIPFTQ